MADENRKKSGDGSGLILKLLLLIPTALKAISNITFLIKRRTYVAGKNIVFIIILAILFACLLSSTWVGVLIFLFFFLLHLQWSCTAAGLTVLGSNFLLLLLISLAISRAKNHIFSERVQSSNEDIAENE